MRPPVWRRLFARVGPPALREGGPESRPVPLRPYTLNPPLALATGQAWLPALATLTAVLLLGPLGALLYRLHLRRESRHRFLRQEAALITLLRDRAFQSDDLTAVLRQATEMVARTLGVARVSIWRFTPDRAAIRCADLYDLRTGDHAGGVELRAADNPAYFDALTTDEVIAADDARRDPRTAAFTEAYLEPLGITSMLDVPLYLFGRLEGVLCYEHLGPPRAWQQDEEYFGLAAAHLVALAEEHRERRRTQRQLEEARAAAEAASRAKSALVATVSHEVRTPLNGILGLTESLQRGAASPEQREALDLLRTSAEGMLTVLNDLLDFSKIEAGKLALHPAPFDLRAELAAATGLFAARARERGLRLESAAEADVPAWLLGDRHRVRQILANLVGNAVKFTERGEVAVRASLGDPPAGSGPRPVVLTVRDTGVGIPPERLQSVFEAFEQAHPGRGGTGLGLTICRRLAELMGGGITVAAEPGRGSTFRVRLPLPPAAPPAPAAPPEAAAPTTALRPLRILLAEDNRINQVVAARVLEKRGHSVRVVEDGRQALQAVRGEAFDVVVMDVQMPVMDGLEATREIRRAEREAGAGLRLPVLAATAGALEGDREACLAAGCDGYVSKPFRPAELLDAIARVVPAAKL